MSSTCAKLNRPKRRWDAVYRRGYEDGVVAAENAAVDAEPVAWLRHGEEKPVQNVPFGAMWISDKSDPRAFPVFEKPPQNLSVVSLIWEPHGKGWRGRGPLIYSVYPAEDGDGWWAALWMAGYLPFRELCKSPDAAKAACQEDFEVRIRDAVSTQVQDVANVPADWNALKEHALQKAADANSSQPGYIGAREVRIVDAAIGAVRSALCEQVQEVAESENPSHDAYAVWLKRNGYPHTAARALAFEYGWRAHRKFAAAPAKQEGGNAPQEGLSNACRFESGSLTEAGWTVSTVAASKPAENKRSAAAGPATPEGEL